MLLEANLSNLFPINISSHMVKVYALQCIGTYDLYNDFLLVLLIYV